MIAVLTWETFVVPAITFIFGGGIVTAYQAFYKVKPEAGQIVVTAAEGALIVQTGVIGNLNKEIERLHTEIAELKKENEQLRASLAAVLTQQKRHDKEIKSIAHGEQPK